MVPDAFMLQFVNMQERYKHGEAVSRELVIIVGRGQHVQQGGPKLREAIEQLLRDQLHMDLNQVTPVSQLLPSLRLSCVYE